MFTPVKSISIILRGWVSWLLKSQHLFKKMRRESFTAVQRYAYLINERVELSRGDLLCVGEVLVHQGRCPHPETLALYDNNQ